MPDNRGMKELAVTIANGEAESGVIDMRGYAGGIVVMPAAWTTADLGVKVCGSADGTFVPLKDNENGYGTSVSIDGPVAAAAYMLPLDVFAAPYMKLWSHDGAGSDTNQGAARTLTLFLKT